MILAIRIGRNGWQLAAWCILCCLCWPGFSQAQMFKYQDDQGRWHFTDRAPDASVQNVESLSVNGEDNSHQMPEEEKHQKGKPASAGFTDLAHHLTHLFKPNTPVEKASIAVVGIQSKLGGGSGFFITQTGYIVTNRHVIRPSEATSAAQDKINQEVLRLQGVGERLKVRKQKLNKYSKELQHYKTSIQSSSGKTSKADMAEY